MKQITKVNAVFDVHCGGSRFEFAIENAPGPDNLAGLSGYMRKKIDDALADMFGIKPPAPEQPRPAPISAPAPQEEAPPEPKRRGRPPKSRETFV